MKKDDLILDPGAGLLTVRTTRGQLQLCTLESNKEQYLLRAPIGEQDMLNAIGSELLERLDSIFPTEAAQSQVEVCESCRSGVVDTQTSMGYRLCFACVDRAFSIYGMYVGMQTIGTIPLVDLQYLLLIHRPFPVKQKYVF